MVALFAVGRVVTDTNPLYRLGEPLLARLNALAAALDVSRAHTMSPSDVNAFELQTTQEENEQLRRQLALPDRVADSVAAEVTLRSANGFDKTVWINQGSQAGVTDSAAVLADGALIGLVERTYERSAMVRLVTDPTFRLTVASGDLHGIMKVDHGSLIVDLLPSKDREGEAVISDGLDGVLPSGVPIGQLGPEFGDAGDVFGRYFVTVPVNPLDVQTVAVVKTERRE
jgi:rod shape-determining protein MreC